MSTENLLPHYTSMANSTPSKSYPADNKDASADTNSLSSSSSSITATRSYTPNLSSSSPFHAFHKTQTYQIRTPGKACSNYHSTTSASEIPIELYPSGLESFRSVRTNKYKGNSTLYLTSSGDNGEGMTKVAETVYRNMPGKHTTMQLFSLSDNRRGEGERLIEEFELRGVLLSRGVQFTSSRFGSFVWKYASRAEKKVFSKQRMELGFVEGKVDNLLVLKRFLSGSKGEMVDVARLVRGEGTRGEGTNRWNTEGNGGRLEIDCLAMGGGKEVDESEVEGLVVATILVMLKREVDALTSSQVVAIS